MTRTAREAQARSVYFEDATGRLAKLASRFVDDPEAIVEAAGARFDSMLPTLPYVDKPDDLMAPSLLICAVNLALYLGLRERGVDVHDFGAAMLDGLTRAPVPPPEVPTDTVERDAHFATLIAAAEDSQRDPAPGEFVYDAFREGHGKWGMNITSCGICALYSQHDAMDLVPYMCATDDVMSDKGGQGLRRTGTIALGAPRCDFRYEEGGAPLRVAEQYPDRIRVLAAD